MLMTRPRPPRGEDPLQSLAAITIRTLHLSQSWPRSHDLLSPVLCSLMCSCTLPLRIRTLRVSKHRPLAPTLGTLSPGLSPAFPIPSGHSSRQSSLSKLSEADNIREARGLTSAHVIGHWLTLGHFTGHWHHIGEDTSVSSNKADVHRSCLMVRRQFFTSDLN